MIKQIKKELRALANPKKAKVLAGFFKTGKGEYGEGDVFLGIAVPETRKVAKKFTSLALSEIRELLHSPVHEERLTSLFILINKYNKSSTAVKKDMFDFYIQNAKSLNNWDLVDLSAAKIAGNFLLDKDKAVLYRLAKSKSVWERRIAIISTYEFIRNMQFDDTFKIAGLLLHDKHDLIHKAVGWMLREVGKRDQAAEEKFLKKHAMEMPRTALRYAIERFDEKSRHEYLKK